MSLKNRLIFCAQVPLLTNIPLPEQKDQKVCLRRSPSLC
jgi:hypothetical protein